MPEQMTDLDKDKDLQAAPPVAQVSDSDEKDLHLEKSEVDLELDESKLSPRDLIYKKHDELNRPTTLSVSPKKDEVEEELKALADAEKLEKGEKKKPGPKPQVEVTVNGNTRKVDKAKVEAAGGVEPYQMMVAGQEKLRIISQRQKALDDGEAELKRRQEEFEATSSLAPVGGSAKEESDLATPVEDQLGKLRQQANEALLEGDVEESARLNAEADKSLREGATNDAVQHMETIQQNREEAQREAARKAQATQRASDIEEGTAHFAMEYPEIMGDKHLLQLADNQTIEIVKEHPDWTPTQVMHQAGKNVTKWLDDQNVVVEPSSQERKALEKRSMGSPHGGSKRSQRKPEPKQQTRGDYVLELQRQRGQIP